MVALYYLVVTLGRSVARETGALEVSPAAAYAAAPAPATTPLAIRIAPA